jgi:hypothetical protein
MIAVDEVYVGVSRWTEDYGVAWGEARVGVGGGVGGSEVGFGFDYAPGEELAALAANQQLA